MKGGDKMLFVMNDIAVISGREWACIISNDEIAVMGKRNYLRNGGYCVDYEGCSIYSNKVEHRDLILGLERIEGWYGVEKTSFEPDWDACQFKIRYENEAVETEK